MTLLVTGATGEIGGSLIERLTARWDVRILSRRSRPNGDAPVAVRWVRGDLADGESLVRACQGVEIVLHMAALTHSRRTDDYLKVNVDGTARLLRAARDAGVARFVHLSTRAIGAAGGAYSLSKELAELEVRAVGPPWVILRPAEVYGGGGDPVLTLGRSLRSRPFVPILGDGRYRLSPVYVDDIVDAIVAALDFPRAAGRTYVLAGPEEITYLELVERLEKALGLPRRRRLHIPLAAAKLLIHGASRLGVGGYVPDQIPRLLLAKSSDNSAAVRDLGFSPRSLEEGLKALQ
ncbi:MAG: NAD-dependent epimerase/dehydratase family protein [Thermoanaerobaculia bacterium]